MSKGPKKVRWAIVMAAIFVVVISFPPAYSTHQSVSTTSQHNTSSTNTSTSDTATTTVSSGQTYPAPKEICSDLPKEAIGNATASPQVSSVDILIVEADIGSSYEGINGSAFHINTNWPVITVYQGQKITVHVVNCPSSPEPHGFAIGNYFASGVTLSPGQSYTFTFVANTVGRFTVFCNVFCAIHQYMQNGELLVKPLPPG